MSSIMDGRICNLHEDFYRDELLADAEEALEDRGCEWYAFWNNRSCSASVDVEALPTTTNPCAMDFSSSSISARDGTVRLVQNG